MMMLLPLFLLSLRVGLIGSVSSPVLTFIQTDPITGAKLECDRCPPGTFLRSRCTATQQSDCAPCPQGSFTELWNHIGKCLRCGVCGMNQVVKSACTASGNCQCECKQGYYYKAKYDLCLRHSQCPAGQGVLTRGTATQDTVCHTCPNGTFSDADTAQLDCIAHKSCADAGLQLVLRGSSWHDSVCMSCADHGSNDGANYLREIIPAFFRHHKMNIKRLRRIAHNLPTEDGKRHVGTSTLSLSEVNALINTWISSTTPKQIRQLPTVLTKVGANSAGERLQNKLHRLDSCLKERCSSGHEGVMVIVSE